MFWRSLVSSIVAVLARHDPRQKLPIAVLCVEANHASCRFNLSRQFLTRQLRFASRKRLLTEKAESGFRPLFMLVKACFHESKRSHQTGFNSRRLHQSSLGAQRQSKGCRAEATPHVAEAGRGRCCTPSYGSASQCELLLRLYPPVRRRQALLCRPDSESHRASS